MINTNIATKYCKEDISLIENYDKAMNDPTQIYECHHKLGLKMSRQELIKSGLYYGVCASDLIFLTNLEHTQLHAKNRYEGWNKKISEAGKTKTGSNNNFFGHKHTDAVKKRLSELHKGTIQSEETCRKKSESMKGKPGPNKGKKFGKRSAETKKKMSEAMKKAWEKRKTNR